MMMWDKRTGLSDSLRATPDILFPKGPTCKKGTPGLWIEERLFDGQLSPESKSKVNRKRMLYELDVSNCQPLFRGG